MRRHEAGRDGVERVGAGGAHRQDHGRMDAVAAGPRYDEYRFASSPIRRRSHVAPCSRRCSISGSRWQVATSSPPAIAARTLIEERGLSPHLVVHPDLLEDFDVPSKGAVDVVIIGDAGGSFSYQALNEAFRLIEAGAAFIALARNRTFKDTNGQLSLDAGPFVAALEFASRRDALLVGKPSASFYAAALADLGTSPRETVMIGDDVEADVAGAVQAGMGGGLGPNRQEQK